MPTELKQRLRAIALMTGFTERNICSEAADRIETLEAEIERLRDLLREYGNEWPEVRKALAED
tara:strand:+ start:242 stop:430 length:189 start_codon:yes stop_codon:yes gene_type:complete